MTVQIEDVRHIKVCGNTDTYCGHPRQGGIFNFGNGEIAVIHDHAPCAYQERSDVSHGLVSGYKARAAILLQRSLDGGETWPEESNLVIFDHSAPLEERRAFLFSDGPREELDMSRPESAFFFGRTASGEMPADGTEPSLVVFALRSVDKGRTWEKVPTIVAPPGGTMSCLKDNHPLVRMADGTFLGALSCGPPGGVALYGTDDDGLTWEHVSWITADPTGFGRTTYAGLLLLPGGRLQCYTLNIGGLRNAIQMNYSDDGGYSWGQPRPIVKWGRSPWRARRKKGVYGGSVFYRSPWPMILRDGRILVLFGRRKPPYGIGGLVSEDEGVTWSEEFIVRDDGSSPDLGYPVATRLDDGRIFTAYYFTLEDGNKFGGSRFIGGSFFRVK